MSDGVVSELSFDSGDVTAASGTSTVVRGELENACSAWGIAVITFRPVDTTCGAGSPTSVGEVNGVIVAACADARA